MYGSAVTSKRATVCRLRSTKYDIAKKVVERLRFDSKTQTEVAELVLYHDTKVEPTTKAVKRWLNKLGEQRFLQFLDVRMADMLAHTPGTQQSRIERCQAIRKIFDDVIAESQCFSLKDLKINGNHIIALGCHEGKMVGAILNWLLGSVIDGDIPNDYESLLEEAKKYL